VEATVNSARTGAGKKKKLPGKDFKIDQINLIRTLSSNIVVNIVLIALL
jgi:hypothetical protein